ncbi:MAG: nucleotidyltransferase domain-containing protein, partial [Desulfurococcales archaeon]|nr:nucleotidyltransferase domain-containing protein [Desulfurococcales archaeon]
MGRCSWDRGHILGLVRPTPTQYTLLSRLYRIVESRLRPCLERLGLRTVVEAEGSYAKGTLLSDKWEIDVFVVVDADRRWIREESLGVLLDCLQGLPVVTKYSQHPYVTVSLMGMEADVVPVKMVGSPGEALGVERTPFHTRWVRERITEDLADEVRLLKSFLKGIGVYGAETARGGFSGYLAEVLTITYGGFMEVLREASRWRPPVRVDPVGHGDWGVLERKYRGYPLIVVDPVDPVRNLAGAVTLRSLSTCLLYTS